MSLEKPLARSQSMESIGPLPQVGPCSHQSKAEIEIAARGADPLVMASKRGKITLLTKTTSVIFILSAAPSIEFCNDGGHRKLQQQMVSIFCCCLFLKCKSGTVWLRSSSVFVCLFVWFIYHFLYLVFLVGIHECNTTNFLSSSFLFICFLFFCLHWTLRPNKYIHKSNPLSWRQIR